VSHAGGHALAIVNAHSAGDRGVEAGRACIGNSGALVGKGGRNQEDARKQAPARSYQAQC
jgi:hypothetical protein